MEPFTDVSFTGLGMGADLVVIVAVYFAPSVIAGIRRHHQTGAIVVLNLLLGWTVLTWIGALVWALTATPGKGVRAS